MTLPTARVPDSLRPEIDEVRRAIRRLGQELAEITDDAALLGKLTDILARSASRLAGLLKAERDLTGGPNAEYQASMDRMIAEILEELQAEWKASGKPPRRLP
jgi:ABC-type transporter Mla subunit MlaD